jgi:large subunit ribosomal protein L4
VARRRVDGTVIDAIVLDPSVFGIVPNTAVLHQVITAQLAAARSGTQSTRTRAEVRGGGAKPFRQKGTGRARQGSIRSPQWTGGGVALGPKPRSYHQRTPKKMITLALYSALSDRAGEGRVALVDEWTFPAPKTKDAIAALSALGLEGKVLVVLGPDDGIPDRSFANLPDVRTIQAPELNAYDIMRSDWVVFTDRTVPGETSPGSLSDVTSVPGGKSAPDRASEQAPVPLSTALKRARPGAAEKATAQDESAPAGTDPGATVAEAASGAPEADSGTTDAGTTDADPGTTGAEEEAP